MIKEIINTVEKQMQDSLAEVRKTFRHSGNKGANIEDIFAKFIRQYLPRKCEIGNGEIIDSIGNRSGQIDIIIVNDDHPFTFTQNKPGLFFIEGVMGIGEIKTILTSSELTNSLNNSILYRKLKIKHSKGSFIQATESDLKRYYEHPPFFLFAFESQISLNTIKQNIDDFITNNRLDQTDSIDGIFVLDKGWLINFGDGKGTFKFKTSLEESASGWIIHESKTLLFDLLCYLSATMPRIIRFEPILMHYIFSKD